MSDHHITTDIHMPLFHLTSHNIHTQNFITAYTPPPKTTAPRRSTTISSSNKRAPQSAAAPPPANLSANPFSTIFQVYTRETTPATPLSKEEAQLKKDRQYTLITGLPLKPYFERKTIRKQITPDIWTFEQPQGE